MPARPLAFRYLYKSGVIKENTVTVFGELGEVFKPGTDYDEEVNLTVPYMDLSNLIMYYTGTVADGTVGSTVEGSLRNLNAPVTNVRTFLKFSNADNASGASHYYIGDIVMFDPITGEGTSPNASCWTCIRTTTDLASPIPELANEIAAASAAGTSYNTNFNNTGRSGPGMSGIDNRGQRFITGVMPALYDSTTGDITTNPYWRESALAKSYVSGGNYYQGELVVYNGGVYQCKSTNGFLADPQLYQRTRYTVQQELDDAAGDTSAIPPLDPALAPQGAFGYDSSGTRYLMGVPPAGGLFSGLFWEPATLPKTPSGAYLNINWDNTSITNKLQFYDANVVGGGGAQSIPTFTDDIDNTITTLRKIYDDNEKSFVLTIANQILSSIPAAAIKSQAVNSKVEPDNTLVELVNLGPTNSKPSAYTPAVQGLFEESIARDMLRIAGYANTITELVITDGSSGYTSPPSVQILNGLASNPKLVPYYASAVARLGVKGVKIDKTNNTWNSTNTGKRYAVGDVLTFAPAGQAPEIPCAAKVYRVDSAGNILSVIITNKGSGYRALPTINVGGATRTFLEADLEVVSVDLQYRDQGFYDDMRVVVEYGSGAGAVGYAVTQQINGQTRLVEVKFDGTTKFDATANETYSISRGSNYVSGNFKKDIVALQGYGAGGAVTAAKSIGVVTSVQGGAIASLVVINNGSGYTSNPNVIIGRPNVDSRESASLDGTPITLSSFLPLIANSGVYTEAPVPTFTIADTPTNADATKVQGRAYLGLNVADVRFGGSGFSQGEYMSVSGGGITTAKFNVAYDQATDTYSALVMDGGDGYTYNGADTHLNQFVLKDDRPGAVAGDELRAEITSVGGGIVDLTFNNGRPTGEGFTLDDIIEVTAASGNFRFKVTSVGDEGTIAPDGYAVSGSTAITGYLAGQTLTATSKYLSIDTLSVITPEVYGTTQPTVTIAAPTGTVPGGTTGAVGSWAAVQATATVSLKVGSISITTAGTGFQLGDVVTVRQTGAVSCEAFVLALSNTTTGSVGVIAVRNAGSGFDLSATGSGAIEVVLPTTSGTPLQVNVSYVVHKIVVTNPGSGYVTSPTATIDEGGNSQPLSVTTKNAGGSTATFQVVSVDGSGVPTVNQASPGAGYLVDDLLELTNGAGDATGAYVLVQDTQSRGVRAGTMLPGYRGKGNTVSTTLIDAACSKIGSAATFPNIKYAITKVTGPTSISSIEIREYSAANTRYPSPTLLTHKPHARVKVGNVDSIGSILTLTVESPGYGYESLPLIKPMPGTRGSGASLFAVSLGVSRVEFTGATKAIITSSDVTVTGNGIIPAPQKKAATAIAQLAGDLNIISTDQMKNPNILETLELLKPGSTSGYAQAKPNMGVSSVNVVFAGRAYPTGQSAGGQDLTFLEVTEPDLPNGVAPTFDIQFDGVGGITNVVVLTSGSGYSKLPKALVKVRTGSPPSVEASVTLNMKLLSGYVTSGGEGYRVPPTVTVAPPDLNIGNSVSTLLPTMKASINGFNIEDPGSQFITTPQAIVVGPGNGADATPSMGVSDIYVVNGGSGYSVGDMLQFDNPTTSGGDYAAATVLAVSATGGSITRVGLAKSSYPVVVANIARLKNDFILNGGSGYTELPTISAIAKVPDGTNTPLYAADNELNGALADSPGTGAVFSVRLGVKNLNFISGGSGYESDATVLIQPPPSSQAANISGIINSVGQLDDFIINSSGSGYTRPPATSVVGNGVGATVTPIMGVTEVSIITTGSGYRVGDVVSFTGGNPTEPANGVVTVVEGGGSGIGYDLGLTTSKTITDANLTVDNAGKIVGTVGAIEEAIVIEGGYQFRLGDIITILPETRFPTREALDSLRVIGNTVRISNGALQSIAILNIIPTNDFKAGIHLKVTPAAGSSIDPDAVAYIRLNLVYDGVTGGGWHSINPQYDSSRTNIISPAFNINTPGDKYGQPYPAYFFTFDGISGTVEQVEGIQGDPITVLASNDKWGTNPSLITNSSADFATQKLRFDIVTQDEAVYPNSTAYFKVTQVLTSVGATIQATPCQEDGTLLTAGQGTGKFFSYFDKHEYTSTPRGRLSFIQVLNPGKGYQSNPTAVITSATVIETARLVTTLGVVEFRIDQRGSGYTSNPDIRISSPDHRALTAKGYARSGVFDIDGTDTFEILDQGAGYTGEFLDGTGAAQDGGTYRLVGGALHATGGSAESIDTVLTIGAAGFTSGKLKLDIAAVQAAAVTFIRGSNYRVGDVVTLLPIGTTTSGNNPRPASIRIKAISKILDRNNGMNNNATYNTGVGILDYAKQENGEDVGGYGTGYFEPPSVIILGGNQGVTLATSLGVVAVDKTIAVHSGGLDYQVGDLVQMVSPEISVPVNLGVVSRVDSYIGEITNVRVYEPYTTGLSKLPSISVIRADPAYRSPWSQSKVAIGEWVRKDANLFAVLGVTVAATTTSSDGFIGRPYVYVEPPTGSGYVQQPTSARVTPNVVNEVSGVNVFYDNTTPEYTTSIPLISITPPPSIEKYSGWRSVRFNKDDSFEAIVQYTIAKAVSFQVDPDATLPGYYFTASSITIGGVVIPLRQSGGKGMQGRELSSNRIIRRYKVKFIAI
jgi:hypothetical protein